MAYIPPFHTEIVEDEGFRNTLDYIEFLNYNYLLSSQGDYYRRGKRLSELIDNIKHFRLKNAYDNIKRHVIEKRQWNKIKNKTQRKFSTDLQHTPFIELDTKIEIYTAITGGYDKYHLPLVFPDNLKYHLFSDISPLLPLYAYYHFLDNPSSYENKEKDIVDIPDYSFLTSNKDNCTNTIIDNELSKRISFKDITTINIEDNIFNNGEINKNFYLNRFLKTHPHFLFPDSDFAIYADGKLSILSDTRPLIEKAQNSPTGIAMHTHDTRDCLYEEGQMCIYFSKGNKKEIRKQMNKYEREGFPHHYGLLEAGVIVVDLHNPKAKEIMDRWWEEIINSDSGRDQLALPYVLWKMGISLDDIGILGNNLFLNPIFRRLPHEK